MENTYSNEAARAELVNLIFLGYTIVSSKVVKDYDANNISNGFTTEAIVKIGDKVSLIQWVSFNKGFMVKGECGWTIFKAS